MANKEKTRFIDHLADADELGPEGDLEAQLMGWHQVRQGQVSGEIHCKAAVDAARVRARIFEAGLLAGLADASAKMGWNEMVTLPGLHRLRFQGQR